MTNINLKANLPSISDAYKQTLIQINQVMIDDGSDTSFNPLEYYKISMTLPPEIAKNYTSAQDPYFAKGNKFPKGIPYVEIALGGIKGRKIQILAPFDPCASYSLISTEMYDKLQQLSQLDFEPMTHVKVSTALKTSNAVSIGRVKLHYTFTGVCGKQLTFVHYTFVVANLDKPGFIGADLAMNPLFMEMMDTTHVHIKYPHPRGEETLKVKFHFLYSSKEKIKLQVKTTHVIPPNAAAVIQLSAVDDDIRRNDQDESPSLYYINPILSNNLDELHLYETIAPVTNEIPRFQIIAVNLTNKPFKVRRKQLIAEAEGLDSNLICPLTLDSWTRFKEQNVDLNTIFKANYFISEGKNWRIENDEIPEQNAFKITPTENAEDEKEHSIDLTHSFEAAEIFFTDISLSESNNEQPDKRKANFQAEFEKFVEKERDSSLFPDETNEKSQENKSDFKSSQEELDHYFPDDIAEIDKPSIAIPTSAEQIKTYETVQQLKDEARLLETCNTSGIDPRNRSIYS